MLNVFYHTKALTAMLAVSVLMFIGSIFAITAIVTNQRPVNQPVNALSSSSNQQPATDTHPTNNPVSNSQEDLIIANDHTLGNTTKINLVVLTKPSFVVIYSESQGKPDKIIGNSHLLPVGPTNDLIITLTRETQNEEPLYAILHLDDGDGQFDPQTDNPLTNTSNQPVIMKYIVGAMSLHN